MSILAQSRPLDATEKFMNEWAAESIKANIATANSTLSQLLTLSTALTGSGVYFLNEKVLPPWALTSTLLLLFVSLLTCMAANMPNAKDVDIANAEEFYEYKRSTLILKKRKISICAFMIAASLLLAGSGVLFKSFAPSVADNPVASTPDHQNSAIAPLKK